MNLKVNKSYGRDIFDEVAQGRIHLNPEMYYTAEKTPVYLYGVQNETSKLKFDTGKKERNTEYPLIFDIVSGVTVMALRDGDAYIKLIDDEGVVIDTIESHPKIVALIKVCIAASVNANEDYSKVISAFVKELLSRPNSISVPIILPEENKYQKLLGESLNKFLLNLCEDNGIKVNEIISSKPVKKSKTTNLFDTIGMVNG